MFTQIQVLLSMEKKLSKRGNSFGEEKNFSTPSVRGVGGSTVIDLTDDGLGERQLAHNLTMSRFFYI